MTEESNIRRPSIATIFNPRRSKASNMATQLKVGKTLHPRPSVVVTDEDTPTQPVALTNGVGDPNDVTNDTSAGGTDSGGLGVGGTGGLQAITRDRSSTVSDRGVSVGVTVGVGARGIGSRASSGSLNITGTSSNNNRVTSRQVRSPSINLATTAQPETELGKYFFLIIK